jgi:ribonuclease D
MKPSNAEDIAAGDKTAIKPPILITDDAGLQGFLEAAWRAPIIGVDTESNSLFAYYHQICLIQVSLPHADYVIDPLAVDVNPLGALFADPGCEKIFHAAENDILGFKRDYGFDFANLFDTMIAARILGWEHAGLAGILKQHFGVALDKRLQRTNWGQRPLRAEQLAYAQLDTYYLLPLRERQVQELQARGRWDEAQESFERLPTLEWSEKPFDDDGFWRINGARHLGPKELAVLKEIYLYREHQAQQRNRPPFKVLDQRVMMAISRRQPQSIRALRRIKGMSADQTRRYGDGIVSAVKRGLKAAPPEPPRRTSGNGRPDPATLSRYEALRNWRTERARQRGVDPDIVLTNDQLMVIARRAPSSEEELLGTQVLGTWKLTEYGQDILHLLADA